ncbi:MAG TPA: hypothetical protein VFM37_11025 [Pseudonocardiaceae bacterium]|nr:hypothetical protein [Pseudonocardiaceae bacterium]
MSANTTPARTASSSRTVRTLAILLMVFGAVLAVAGVTTWIVVQNQLADENITVSEDAARFAGEPVDGPFTAYEQAQVIEKHALEASGGQTYAQLDREDERRPTVMNASFLRASLFTSVVAFGVAAMAFGLGIVVILIGYALSTISRQLAGQTAAA